MKYEYQKYQKRRKKRWPWFLAFLFFGFLGLMFLKTSFTISQVTDNNGGEIISKEEMPELPVKNPDRINVLLLGMRGSDDPGEGKFLSDTIVLLSFNQKTGKAGLISLPRDLYVEIWGLWEKKKINAAYAYTGFEGIKNTVALTTNQYIDYTVSVDFQALTKLIDTLGGVTVYLDNPFEEAFQWMKEGEEDNPYWVKREIEEATTTDDLQETATSTQEKWVFYVPAGRNDLNGQAALYYARSRFSSSDFDRMRRQQEILMAIKDKALSLGVLANPVKIYNLLDLLGKNVKTDMSLGEMKDMIALLSSLDIEEVDINSRVFDDSAEGLLYHSFINDEYVLLPMGDNFNKIQEVCEGILE